MIQASGARGGALGPYPAAFIIAVVAMIAAMAAILLAMGRVAVCECGLDIWHGARFSPENSQHLFDWWTLTHIVHGFLFYGVLRLVFRRAPPWTLALAAVLLEVAWEVWENTPFIVERYRTAGFVDYFGDSVVNSVGDVLGMLVGLALAMRLPLWAGILTVIALEGIAVLVIRDSLLLNIVMLIYPVQAIQEWQAGA